MTVKRARLGLALLVGLLMLHLALTRIPPAPATAPCQMPAALGDGWESASPEAEGIDSAALCAALTRAGAGSANIHGVVVARHGRLVGEFYRHGQDHPINVAYGLPLPFTPHAQFDAQTRHDIRSISKSVVGLLVGIAQHKGQIGAVNTPVFDYLPEAADLRTSERATIDLEDLLTMSSGLQWYEESLPNDETRLYWEADQVRLVLGRPATTQPGTVFHYNSGGTAVLATVLTRVSGQSLTALARDELFGPLGITDWEWATDARGRELAFTGLRMRPRDLLKLGQLMLNGGQWQGQQIVPADWVVASLTPKLDTPIKLPASSPHSLQYGYQWWTGITQWRGKALRWSAGFGNGGQRVFVLPELELTVVIFSGAYGDGAINETVNTLFDDIVATVP